jgi:hypothetical protein
LTLQVSCADPKSKTVRTVCPLGDDVYFKEGKLRVSLPRGGVPTTGGYLLSATFAFGSEQSSYELKAEGAYKSADNWSVTVKENVKFDMGPGMSAVGFDGVVKRGKEKIDGEDKVVLTFDIKASITIPEFANAVDVKKVSARITNLCEKTEPNCKATEIRFKTGVDLEIPAPGGKKIQAALTGEFNWKTKGMVFKAESGPPTALGPDEWNFTSGSIVASRAGYGYCQAQEIKERAPEVWGVGFQGKGTLFGGDADLTLQFSKDGSCIWGKIGEMKTGTATPTQGVVASWTSFPKGALIKEADDKAFKIKANTGSLKGKVKIPADLASFIGQGDVKLDFTGEITGAFQGATFEIAIETQSGANVVTQGANSFDLTKIALGMKWKRGDSAELFAGAEGRLTVKGDQAKQIADSVTPMGVYFSVRADTTGVAVTLTAGIAGDTPVDNAFGVQGLTLRELGVSATFKVPAGSVQVSFAADVSMPKAWESSGFKAGAPVRLAFSVGNAAPWCIDFQIGIQGGQKVALDVANAGYLVANYFRILIAPSGCTVQIKANQTRTIPPGFGFAFDGHIMGAPIIVALNVGLGTGGTRSEFTMQGQLRMPKLDLPLVTLSGANGKDDLTITLDIDTAARKYDADVDASVLVGYPDWGLGTRVAINAQLRTSDPKEVLFKATGSATFGVSGAYMKLNSFTVDLAVPKGTLVPSRGSVAAQVEFGILGVKLLSGAVDMAYDRGHLVQFGVLVGVSLDIKVASVSGNLAFRYCLGSIGSSRTSDGGLADCTPFKYQNTARPGYRIDLGGIMRVLVIKKSYYWNIHEQEGGEGDPAFEPKAKKGPLPGPTADIDQKDKATVAFLRRSQNRVMLYRGSEPVAFRSIRPAKVTIERESRTVKPCSSVEVGMKPYSPASGTYPPGEPLDPVDSGDCGLIGAYDFTDKSISPETVPIVCSALECVDDKVSFRVGGPTGSLREARNTILTLLRVAPGVLSPGARVFHDPDAEEKGSGTGNWVKDKGALSGLQAILRVIGPVRGPNGRNVYPLVLYETSNNANLRPIGPRNVMPESTDPDVYYFLTDRGVLRSSADGGWSMGDNAALAEAPAPESQPVLALVGQKMVVYCGPTSDSGILWTYGENGYTKVKECKARS